MTGQQVPALPETDEFREALAAELRALLARNRLSYRALAQRFGWSPSKVSRRLSGKQPWDIRDLMMVCYALGSDIGTVTEAARQAALAAAQSERGAV